MFEFLAFQKFIFALQQLLRGFVQRLTLPTFLKTAQIKTKPIWSSYVFLTITTVVCPPLAVMAIRGVQTLDFFWSIINFTSYFYTGYWLEDYSSRFQAVYVVSAHTEIIPSLYRDEIYEALLACLAIQDSLYVVILKRGFGIDFVLQFFFGIFVADNLEVIHALFVVVQESNFLLLKGWSDIISDGLLAITVLYFPPYAVFLKAGARLTAVSFVVMLTEFPSCIMGWAILVQTSNSISNDFYRVLCDLFLAALAITLPFFDFYDGFYLTNLMTAGIGAMVILRALYIFARHHANITPQHFRFQNITIKRSTELSDLA